MGAALLARKLGMAQVFSEDGRCYGVTVLEAGPCPVVQVKSVAVDGYDGVQVGFGALPKKVNRPARGHFEAAGLEPYRYLRELPGVSEAAVGDTLTVSAFEAGQKVDVTGVSKGKGFAGQHKRHNFGRGPVTHGSHNIRQAGSVGSVDAARTFKGLPMAGHMGASRSTVQRLEIFRVDSDRNLLLVKGAVPGATGGLLMVSQSRPRIRKVRGQH
ncbi:MAG TPA: 50S ribosomal protein L3 [Candidatus Dormibacteraeota bacterium]|nr:50S ribosomal protein L3 [Candidatus Dormibacteraeota bacterium]